jgi:hypothetical protein
VCTDTSPAVYLRENFSIDVENEKKLDGVVCDWNAPVQRSSIFSQRFGIVCENKDEGYKILAGWVSSSMNNSTVLFEVFGVQQLADNKLVDHGQVCVNHPAVAALRKEIKNLVQAGQCELSGQPANKNLFSQTFFFLPPGIEGRRFFVRVMDMGNATSKEKIDSFMVGMFKF